MGNLNKKANWAIGLSVVAIILSGVMLIMWCCNAGGFKAVELDTFVGVIVALLAIIVTIAIGWQIFNIYEVRSQLNRIKRLERDLHRQQIDFENMKLRTGNLHAITFANVAITRKEYCEAFYYLLEAINFSLQLPSHLNLDSTLLSIEEECINKIKAGTFIDKEIYERTLRMNRQICNQTSYNCIKRRYSNIFDEYLRKVCVDDDQK